MKTMAKIKSENVKFKKDLKKLSTICRIFIENKDHAMALDNENLREENKTLKLENNHLTTGLQKFFRGQYLLSELLMNAVNEMDKHIHISKLLGALEASA